MSRSSASVSFEWLAKLASLMIAAELLLALHLSANAIESDELGVRP